LGSQDRPLSELMKSYETYSASGEINSTVDDAAARTASVVDAFSDRTVSIDRLDGVTVDLGDGAWFNLRASNTEPLLRLNVEARTAGEVESLTAEILGVVRARLE
jgi:phosphomannomutase